MRSEDLTVVDLVKEVYYIAVPALPVLTDSKAVLIVKAELSRRTA